MHSNSIIHDSHQTNRTPAGLCRMPLGTNHCAPPILIPPTSGAGVLQARGGHYLICAGNTRQTHDELACDSTAQEKPIPREQFAENNSAIRILVKWNLTVSAMALAKAAECWNRLSPVPQSSSSSMATSLRNNWWTAGRGMGNAWPGPRSDTTVLLSKPRPVFNTQGGRGFLIPLFESLEQRSTDQSRGRRASGFFFETALGTFSV